MRNFLTKKLAWLACIFFVCINVAQATEDCTECDITVIPLQDPDPSLTCGATSTYFLFQVDNNSPVTQTFEYSLTDLDLAHADLADVFISASTCGSFTGSGGSGSLDKGKSCLITVEVTPTADVKCKEGCINWQLTVTPDNPMITPIKKPIAPCFNQPPGEITVTPPLVPGTLFCGGAPVPLPFLITNHNANPQSFTYSISQISDPNMTLAITASSCGPFSTTMGNGQLTPEATCIVTVTETPLSPVNCGGCVSWNFVMTPDDTNFSEVTERFTTCFQPDPPGPPDCNTDPSYCPQPTACSGSSSSNILGLAANYSVLAAGKIKNNDNPVVTKFCRGTALGNAGSVGTNALTAANTGGNYTGLTTTLPCTTAAIDNGNASDGVTCVCDAIQSYKTARDNAGCTALSGDFGTDIQSLPSGGYYCLTGNTFLNDTLTLNGPGPYYFFIAGDFHVKTPSQVIAQGGLTADQVYWIVEGHHFVENPDANNLPDYYIGNTITVNGDIHIDHPSGANPGRYLTCKGDISLDGSFAFSP